MAARGPVRCGYVEHRKYSGGSGGSWGRDDDQRTSGKEAEAGPGISADGSCKVWGRVTLRGGGSAAEIIPGFGPKPPARSGDQRMREKGCYPVAVTGLQPPT
ncbi:unnamed protein product [Arctogadus glacialis]